MPRHAKALRIYGTSFPHTDNQGTALNQQTDWTIADADELYRISGWGAGYFRLNDDGNLVINAPLASGKSAEIAMLDLIEGMEVRGKTMPVMLRVQNILENQIRLINESFANAIASSHYRGKYRGVFPIKVNQQAQVIEDIVRFGKPWQHESLTKKRAKSIRCFSP